MRMEDGERTLDEVGIHLTSDEARAVIAELTRLLDEMALADFSPNLGGVRFGGRELELSVSTDESGLDDYVAERVSR